MFSLERGKKAEIKLRKICKMLVKSFIPQDGICFVLVHELETIAFLLTACTKIESFGKQRIAKWVSDLNVSVWMQGKSEGKVFVFSDRCKTKNGAFSSSFSHFLMQ